MKLIPLPNYPAVKVTPGQARKLASIYRRTGNLSAAVAITRSLKEDS